MALRFPRIIVFPRYIDYTEDQISVSEENQEDIVAAALGDKMVQDNSQDYYENINAMEPNENLMDELPGFNMMGQMGHPPNRFSDYNEYALYMEELHSTTPVPHADIEDSDDSSGQPPRRPSDTCIDIFLCIAVFALICFMLIVLLGVTFFKTN